jgi:hypothetical protein
LIPRLASTLLLAAACSGDAAEPRPAPAPAQAPAPAAPAVPEGPKPVFLRQAATRFAAGVTAVDLDPELPAEVEVSAVPLVDLVPAVTRTVAMKDGKRRILPIEHPTWKAYTDPARPATSPFDLAILWPACPAARRVDPASLTGLPDTIPKATVTAAIDRDADGEPDLVWADWCCGENAQPLAPTCSTPCGEIWAREGEKWSLYERSGSGN